MLNEAPIRRVERRSCDSDITAKHAKHTKEEIGEVQALPKLLAAC